MSYHLLMAYSWLIVYSGSITRCLAINARKLSILSNSTMSSVATRAPGPDDLIRKMYSGAPESPKRRCIRRLRPARRRWLKRASRPLGNHKADVQALRKCAYIARRLAPCVGLELIENLFDALLRSSPFVYGTSLYFMIISSSLRNVSSR